MVATALGSALRSILAVAYVIALLIVELVTAMLVYMYMNLYHLDTFGALVRFAKVVLDTIVGQMEYWAPVAANAAYATLVGELGPKSILLLLIGLVAGVVVRFVVRLLRRLVLRATASAPVGDHA